LIRLSLENLLYMKSPLREVEAMGIAFGTVACAGKFLSGMPGVRGAVW
jgi:hypothetical protein